LNIHVAITEFYCGRPGRFAGLFEIATQLPNVRSYPQERTYSDRFGISVWCQKATSAQPMD
jgi:hypothetical protein